MRAELQLTLPRPEPESRPSARGARRDPAAALHPRRVFGLVYVQMRALAGAAPDFDDLVQLAAEQALRTLPTFEGRSRLSTWTYRICYHTLLKERRFYRRWLARFALTAHGTLPEVSHEALPADEALLVMERVARLRDALSRVPERRRAVVVLHDLEGLDIPEIAAIVGANPLTVRSRLRDGRRLLAQALAADPYFGDADCARGAP
jgi:RNA polymerase sigma-70 factor, ECF subfamily